MSDQINAINAASSSINRNIEGLKVDVRQSHGLLEKIVGFFTQLQKSVEDGVARLLQNQSMMVLISKTSELESYRELIGEQQSVLEQKKEYLINDLKKLQNRYDKLNTELTESTDSTIQKMDGDVINMSEEYYEKGPGGFYASYSAPLVNRERSYFGDCFLFRQNSVEEKAYGACEIISDFLDAREKFVSDIRSFVSESVIEESHSSPVPIYLAQFKKDEETIIIGPGTVTYSGSSVNLGQDAESLELTGTLKNKTGLIENNMEYRELSSQERVEWKRMVEKLFDSDFIKDTRKNPLKQALMEYVDITNVKVGERNIG